MSPTKPFAKASQRAEFSRRLREELERTGRQASPAALAREINLYLRPAERITPSSCRKWLHAQAIPTQEKLQALASLLQVPTSWLRFGEVTALSEPAPLNNPLSADELALIEGWRRLTSGQRRSLRQLLGQLLQVH